MTKVDAPIVGGSFDTSKPISSMKSLGLAAAGVGLAVMVARYGRMAGDWATDKTDQAVGLDAPEVF